MTIGALNSPLSRRGYTTEKMTRIWDESNTIQCILDVEATLAEVQASLGTVPSEAAVRIRQGAHVTDDLIANIESGKVGNPLIASLDALRRQVPPESRGWVHFGATSQDILDTARALQIHSAIDLLLEELATLEDVVSQLADQHAETLMVARTNGQHALPTTLGMRFARWLAELRRSGARLRDARPRAEMIQFSGGAGTYASMGDSGLRVARGMADSLGLQFEAIPWHASRDGITELCCTVAILGQTLAKIAEDLFDMQETDVQEAHEPMDAHSSGSSTMPQKLNPFSTMKISVGARLAAGLSASLLVQAPGSFERDHRQLEVERDALPQIFVAVEGALSKLTDLLRRLRFSSDALEQNLAREGVLLMSEGIMMALAPRMGQAHAHDLLQDFAAEFRSRGISLEQYLDEHPEVRERTEGIDWHRVTSPCSYIGLSAELSHTAAKERR